MKAKKNEVEQLFAKAYLLNMTEAEKALLDHLLGIAGSFHTSFVEAYQHAHPYLKVRMVDAFPDILEAINRYYTEEEYWKEFRDKYL